MSNKTNKPRTARSLTATLAIAFLGLSALVLLIYSILQIILNIQSQQAALSSRQQLIAQQAGKSVSSFIQNKFSELETAVEFANPVTADPSTRKTIVQSFLGLDPAFRQFALLDNAGNQLVQVSRTAPTLSLQFAAQLKGDLVNQALKGQTPIGAVYIDDATSEPLVSIAVPVKSDLGDIQGTVVAEVDLKFMWDLVDQLKVGQTGYAYVVDDQGKLIAFQDTSRVLKGEDLKNISEVGLFVRNPNQPADIATGVASYTGLLGKAVVGTYAPLGTPPWAVVIELPWQEAYQSVIQNIEVSIAILLAMAVLAGAAGAFVARRLAAPLVDLSNAAAKVAIGDLGVVAKVGGPAEIAQVSSTFNTMTARLRELIGSLEQRVADRTKALATAGEVSRRISSITDSGQLAVEVVNQLQSAFNYYHAHIYLADDAGKNLIMTGGTGEVGKLLLERGHKISVGKGLVGRTAESKSAVIVPDTGADPNWLPNPLLPNTKSEIAVPILLGNQLLGVLDVQNAEVNSLTDQDAEMISSIANQVAVALQNIRQYAETQRTAAQLSEALEIAKLANWEYDVARDRFIFNDHFYSIFHTTAEQQGGYELSSAQYAERLVHPDDVPMVGQEIEKALASTDRHYSTHLEHRVLYADGGMGYISVNVHIDRDSDGRIIRYYGANQDITERKRLEVLAAQRARQQEALNQITQKIQNTITVEAALQVTARELGHALGMKPTLVAIDRPAQSGEAENKN